MKAGSIRINTRSGFSLLELVVVVFILSLFTALALPSFYDIGEGRIKSEAGKIASLLRYLNDTAISRKETVALKISMNNRMMQWNAEGGEKTQKFDSLAGVSVASAGDISSGDLELLFGPAGLNENLIIRLKDSGHEMSVLFNHLSGRVKISGDERDKIKN